MTDDELDVWRAAHDLDVCSCGHVRAEHYGPGGGQTRCRPCARPGRPSHPFDLDPTGGTPLT